MCGRYSLLAAHIREQANERCLCSRLRLKIASLATWLLTVCDVYIYGYRRSNVDILESVTTTTATLCTFHKNRRCFCEMNTDYIITSSIIIIWWERNKAIKSNRNTSDVISIAHERKLRHCDWNSDKLILNVFSPDTILVLRFSNQYISIGVFLRIMCNKNRVDSDTPWV